MSDHQPDWRSVMVDVALMERGKFYTLEVNKDNLTAIFEVEPNNGVIKKEFSEINYMEIPFTGDKHIQVYEKIKSNPEIEVHNLINDAIDIKIKIGGDGVKTCIIQSNRPITGYIILK